MNPAPPSTPKRHATEWMVLGSALAIAAALIGYELQQGHANVEAMERDRLGVQARPPTG